jgi:hypothetical protein
MKRSELSAYMRKIQAESARKRWASKTKEQRSEAMRKVAAARWPKPISSANSGVGK